MLKVAADPEPIATALSTIELAPAPMTTLSSPVIEAPANALPPPAKLPVPSTVALWPEMVLRPEAAPFIVLLLPVTLTKDPATPALLSVF